MTSVGYSSAEYAATLTHLGTPVELPLAGGWCLERAVPGEGSARDAMGVYPLLSCRNWSALALDLAADHGWVSVVAVPDPLGPAGSGDLEAAFPDLLVPFKAHHVVTLDDGWADRADSRHLRKAERAAATTQLETAPASVDLCDEWVSLYATLVARHQITGPADLPSAALRAQLKVPGMWVTVVRSGAAVIGMVLWMVDGERAHYHLGAYSEEGYAVGASFAAFEHGLRHLEGAGVVDVDLGGVAGLSDDPADGLVRFKRGWGAESRIARLGGRIVDHERYAILSPRAGDYFPAYRDPR